MKFELFKVNWEIFFHLDFALSSEREQAAFRQMPIYLFCLFILFLFVYLFVFFFYCKSTAYFHYLLFQVTKAYNFSFLNRKFTVNSNIGQLIFVKTNIKATYMWIIKTVYNFNSQISTLQLINSNISLILKP